MGLDMYLEAHRYVGGWDHSTDEEKGQYAAIVKAAGMEGMTDAGSPHVTVTTPVGYWRKANQVHAWFVEKVQGGQDDCRLAYVTREQLTELKGECLKVLAHVGRKAKAVAAEVLPPQSGFFFGGTDVDQWYFDDLRHTVQVIDKALALPPRYELHYRSSW